MLNLLLACMSKELGYQIGSTLGIGEEVDIDKEGVGWGKYLRVKIQLEVTQPLARGRTINIFGKRVLIAFHCFVCGKIWHGQEAYTNRSGGRKIESEKQYETWLRVPSPRRRGEQNQNRW